MLPGEIVTKCTQVYESFMNTDCTGGRFETFEERVIYLDSGYSTSTHRLQRLYCTLFCCVRYLMQFIEDYISFCSNFILYDYLSKCKRIVKSGGCMFGETGLLLIPLVLDQIECSLRHLLQNNMQIQRVFDYQKLE